jgi:hypothetical protein
LSLRHGEQLHPSICDCVQFWNPEAVVMQQENRAVQLKASPYWFDPNCKYCNELRQVHEKIKKGEWDSIQHKSGLYTDEQPTPKSR